MKKLWTGLLLVALIVGVMAHPISVCAKKNEYYIKINRQQNCITVYEKDEAGEFTVPVKAFACSVGVNNATPAGTFKLKERYRWHELDGKVYGQYCTRITGRVLFHSVYYSTTDPSKLSYNAYNKLGMAASHGCVRLCVADAKWIYDNCAEGTVVEIYDGKDPGPLGKPISVKISASHPNRGWDPTDPDPKNPWVRNAPKLTGVKDKTIERGSAQTKLLKNVKAVDFAGNALEVTLSGHCNLSKIGKYRVSYQAVDALGQISKKQATITVQDTKKPVTSLKLDELELTDEREFFDSNDMKNYLKQFVVAKDSGEKLEKQYIHLLAGNLWNAWELKKYGSYEVTVYAKDAAGNKSKEKTMIVQYVQPETPEEEDPEPAEPTETTENSELWLPDLI